MSIRGGPDIIEDGLVLHLDAADRNSYPVNPELVTNSNLLTLGDGNFETCLRSSTSTIGLDIGPIVSGKTYQIIWNVSARRGTISATFRTGFTVINGSTNANFGTGMKHHVFTSNQTGTLRFYGDGNGCDFDVDYASLREYPSSNSISDLVNNNNGVLTNGPVFTPENAGSIRFDGSNDYISTGKVLIPRNGEYHIEGWVYPNDTNTIKMFITQYNNVNDSGRFQCFFLNDGTIRMHDGGGSMTGSLQSYSANIWQHVCFQRNASNECRTYLNSIPSSPGTRTSTLENTNTLIGTRGSSQSDVWYNGKISNIRIYNKALSADEIRQNYNATKGRFGL